MTKPCSHPNSWFSRSLCYCEPDDPWMHTYCTECGDALDGKCGEDAARRRGMSETPGTEAGPVTAAGRDLVQQLSLSAVPVRWYVLAIEAEARAQHEDALREQGWSDPYAVETDAAMNHGNGIAEGRAQRDAELRSAAAVIAGKSVPASPVTTSRARE